MMLGLGASCTLTYVVAFNCDIPFGLIMLSLFLSVCIMLFINFRKSNNASLYKFILRLILGLITGFVMFFHSPLLIKIVVTVYSLTILSILSYAITDIFHKISVLCIVLFGFNLVVGLLDYNTNMFVYYSRLFNIMTVVSTIAILSFFIILNVDAARWFGSDGLNIPDAMKRTSLIVLAVVCAFIAILSISPWLVEVGGTILNTISGMISNFFSFLFNLISNEPQQEMYIPPPEELGQNGLLFLDLDEPLEESRGVNLFSVQLVIGIILAALLSLLGYILFMFIRYVLRIFGKWQYRASPENDVFTEVVEKITSERENRKSKGFIKHPGYSSLKTERERIIYIYREYVRRAKRNGLTSDSISDTPNEVLEEVSQNISENSFPLPQELGLVFNTVQYGNEGILSVNTESLKQRLL